jgi:hypothetical protein
MSDLLCGIDTKTAIEMILDAVDRGVTTREIRADPLKYLTSGQTKEIIINTGGEGLKISEEIIIEMAKRGDSLAQQIIKKDDFKNVSYGSPLRYAWLEKSVPFCMFRDYDRENHVLIELIKEGKIGNLGGMELRVCKVYVEDYMYEICNANDGFGSEYILGWNELVAKMSGW